MRKQKFPKKAMLLLDSNKKYKVYCFHFNSHQVTLKEKRNVYNTVDIKNVAFDFSNMKRQEIEDFFNLFYKE